MELARGLEPLATGLQIRCAADCATLARVVPMAGLEPARTKRQILSLLCLPIPPHGLKNKALSYIFNLKNILKIAVRAFL